MRPCLACLAVFIMVSLLLGCAAGSRSTAEGLAAAGSPAVTSGDNIPAAVSAEVAAVEARPQAKALREMLAAGEMSNEAIRSHLREEIMTLDTEDPLAGWMTLRLAYMDSRMADWTAARQNFRRVATGEVAAPMEIRAEATTRYARLANAPLERAMAIRSWGEIEEQAGDNWVLRAQARHHIAAMMLEQSATPGAPVGRENVRMFVSDSLAVLPADNRGIAPTRAAIAATGVDSWAKESKWSEFLTAHDKWMEEHGAVATGDDWGNLMYSRGLALAALDRTLEAEAAMVAAMGVDERTQGKRIVLWTRQQSLRWLEANATRQGAADEAAVWGAMLTLISNSSTIDRLKQRATAQERPVEAAMWDEVMKALEK